MTASSRRSSGPGGRPAATFAARGDGRAPDLSDVAQLIKDGTVQNVVIMAGAGISTAAGIPDFRSPETGLYANLEKYQLPYPEAIFDIDYFLDKPQAFYTLAKELYPGNFKPTLTHYFFRLLQEKGLLRSVFTQNIDTLERIAGLPASSIVEAHGSFGEAECLKCKVAYTADEIRAQIQLGEVVRCQKDGCKGKPGAFIKPKIVFFGEGLPPVFFERLPDFHICDLLIVLGTSLSVQPFASLIHRVPTTCPRVLINLEPVGEARVSKTSQRSSSASSTSSTSSNSTSSGCGGDEPEGFDFDGRTNRARGIRDVKYLGTADQGIAELAKELGWSAELDAMFERERALLSVGGAPSPADEDADDAVDALASKVEAVTLIEVTKAVL